MTYNGYKTEWIHPTPVLGYIGLRGDCQGNDIDNSGFPSGIPQDQCEYECNSYETCAGYIPSYIILNNNDVMNCHVTFYVSQRKECTHLIPKHSFVS